MSGLRWKAVTYGAGVIAFLLVYLMLAVLKEVVLMLSGSPYATLAAFVAATAAAGAMEMTEDWLKGGGR